MPFNPIYVADLMLLVCYSIALWLITISNRKLQGMRRLAWAYTAALVSTFIGAFSFPDSRWFVHAVPPTLLLLAFILLHYTFLDFVGRPPRQPWGWICMLGFGYAGFVYYGMSPD